MTLFTDGQDLSKKILPSRAAAKNAILSFADQLSSSPSASEPEDDGYFGPSKRKKGSARGRNVGKARQRDVVRSQSKPIRRGKPPSSSRSVSQRYGRKRPLSPSPSDNSDTLPNPELSSPLSSVPSCSQTPPKSGRTRPLQSFKANDELTRPNTPTPSYRAFRKSLSPLTDDTKSDTQDDRTVSLVWILVDNSGKPVGDTLDDTDRKMWWPAKVMGGISTGTPVTVSLFGEIGSQAKPTFQVKNLSSRNMQPMTTSNGKLRFDHHDFIQSERSYDVETSPRKKQKREIEVRWDAAVTAMCEAEEDDNDGLPRIEAAYSGGSFYSASRRVEAQDIHMDINEPSDTDVLQDTYWSPPPCDDTLEIPGELVLSRCRGAKGYYPAKVKAYIPPSVPKVKPKYRLLFLDLQEQDVPRGWFYTMFEAGFGSCQLGNWENSDNEEELSAEQEGYGLTQGERGPSPLPIYPLPEEFSNMSLHKQLAYVKPVLTAIMNDKYTPSKQRHQDFLKGGARRHAVGKSASSKGRLSAREVEVLRGHLVHWVLRDEVRVTKLADDGPIGEIPLEEESIQRIGAPDTNDKIAVNDHMSPMALSPSIESLQLEAPPSSLTDCSVSVEDQQDFSPAEQDCGQSSATHDQRRCLDSVAAQSHEDIARSGAPIALDDSRVPITPRQRGCEAYEALAGFEKLAYCHDVLLPEAIIQILLWRTGERTSVELLPPDKEQQLHELGASKAEERDWYYDVLRMRKVKERVEKIPPSSSQTSHKKTSSSGTRSRPRKAFRR